MALHKLNKPAAFYTETDEKKSWVAYIGGVKPSEQADGASRMLDGAVD